MLNIFTRFFIVWVFFSLSAHADIKSTTGEIDIDVDSDATVEFSLSANGLGVGISPSTNLHVSGNTTISENLQLGAVSGLSTLEIGGSIGYVAESANTSRTLSGNSLIFAGGSGSNVSLTLPYAGNAEGRHYTIKNISSDYRVNIMGGGNYIDDQLSWSLNESSGVLPYMSLASDGEKWNILSVSDNVTAGENLIGWWRFEEVSGNTAFDSSSYGYNGTLNGGFDFAGNSVANGKIGRCLDFDGDNDYIDIGEFNRHDPQDGSFSVSLWYQFDDPTDTSNVLISKGGEGAISQGWIVFLVGTANNRVNARINSDGNTTNRNSVRHMTVQNTAGVWHHVVMVVDRDAQRIRIYANGSVSNTGASWGGVDLTTGPLNSVNVADELGIGVASDGISAHFDGRIDEVKIFNRLLGQEEVDALYQEGQ